MISFVWINIFVIKVLIVLRFNVCGIDWELIWIFFYSIKGNYKLEFIIE